MKKHITSLFVFILVTALMVQPAFADPFDDDTDVTVLPTVADPASTSGTEGQEDGNDWTTSDWESGNAEDPDISLAQTNIETMMTDNLGGDAAKNAGNTRAPVKR